MNFIRGMLAIQDYAARQEMSSNELSLMLAIFRVYNDRRWPLEPQHIGNNELLSHCTFHGSARDKVLRQTRERLQERGLITFEKGTPYGPMPLYEIRWEALGVAEEPPAAQPAEQDSAQHAAQDTAQHSAHMGGMPGGDHDNNIKNINKDLKTTGKQAVAQEHVCVSGAGTHTAPARWFDPSRPDGADDEAWRYSSRARCAIAQRMIEYAAADGMASTCWVVRNEYGQGIYTNGPDLFAVMASCMEWGMSPGEIMRCRRGETAEWSVELKRAARQYMGTFNYPDTWDEMLALIDAENAGIWGSAQGRPDRRCQ